MSDNRIRRRYNRGTRTVKATVVEIIELVWNDGGRSFEVYTVTTGEDLTVDECFDTMPTDDQIAALIPGEVWTCPCGRQIHDNNADMIVDHARHCEFTG